MLNLGCDAPTRFALRMQDNRDGSATVNSEIYYGLGLDQSANRIGLYSLVFDPTDASADSFPRLYRTDSTTAGVAWSLSNASPLPVGANSYLGFSPIGGSQAGPVAIQHLSSRVTVEAVIAPTNTLDLSSDVVLDGSATLKSSISRDSPMNRTVLTPSLIALAWLGSLLPAQAASTTDLSVYGLITPAPVNPACPMAACMTWEKSPRGT